MAEELDEFGIPIRKKTNTAEVDEFGIPIKKKTSLGTSSSPSKTGGTEFNTANPFGGQPQADFIGQENAQRIQKESAKPVKIDFNKIKPINVDKRSDIAKDLANKRLEKANSKGTDIGNSLGASLNDLYSGIAKIPRYVYELAATPQNYISEKFDIPSLSADYDNLLDLTNSTSKSLHGMISPLSILDAVGDMYQNDAQAFKDKQVKYDQGIWDSITQGKLDDAGNQLVNNIVASAPSMLLMAGTSGASTAANIGIVGKTAINSLPFASSKANEIRTDETIPEYLKPIISAAYGLSEVVYDQKFGTQAIIDRIQRELIEGGTEAALRTGREVGEGFIKGALAKIKQPATDVGRNALEEGMTQWTQNLTDFLTTDPNKDLMEGVADAMIVGGAMGLGMNAGGNVINSVRRSKIEKNNELIAQLSEDVDNPNLPESARESIEERINEIKKESLSEIEKSKQEFEQLTEGQKQEAIEKNAKIEEINASLKSEGVSDQAKSILEEQKSNLEKELSSITSKPETEVVEDIEQTDEYKALTSRLDRMSETLQKNGMSEQEANNIAIESLTPEEKDMFAKARKQSANKPKTKPVDEVKADDEVIVPTEVVSEPVAIKKASEVSIGEEVELVDGKKAIVESIDGDNIVMKMGDGATFSANPKMVEIFKPATNENKQTDTTVENVEEAPVQQPAQEVVAEETVKKERTDDDKKSFAIKEVQRGAINWDGDRFTPRPELGLEWKDIRKGQADLLAGKDSPASRRLIDAIDQAREQGGYNFIQGSGKITNKLFAPIDSDMAELRLTEQDNKNIRDNEEQLAKEYDEWLKNLPEQERQEELNFINDGNENINTSGESKTDVSNQEDATVANPTRKREEIQARRQEIKDRIKEKFKAQRGNLSSGFDPTMLKDFLELGSTYIEDGIVTAREFIRNFREDYEYYGGKQTDITDSDIRNEIFNKVREKQVLNDFDKLVVKDVASDEVSETLSNIERETGTELTDEQKEYNESRRRDALNNGEEIVAKAKEQYGDNYVSELLDYVDDNKGSIPIPKQAIIYITLENDLERQLLSKPKDVTLTKQLALVRKTSIPFARENAIATGMGVLRQIARVGYDLSQVTDSFFSDNQIEGRKKITKAVEATAEDINKEAELQEQEVGEIIVDTPTGEKLRKARQEVDKAKDDFRKFLRKSGATLNSGANVAEFIAQASKLMTAYAKLGIVKVEDVLAQMRTDYGKEFVDDNIENLKKAYTESVKSAQSIQEKVKQALIANGFGREITVTTKDGKEKRNIIDWKKLAGAEGSIDNIRKNVEQYLKDEGYSESDISAMQDALVNEYNRLHASIIEKAIRELERRNKEKSPVNVKNSAQRLAELYNFGLFDNDANAQEYDNLINSAVGLNGLEQDAFNEAKEIARAMATVYEFRDINGKRMSDQAVKKAITDLQSKQEALLTKVASANSTRLYKVVDAVGEFISLGQRFLLARLGQVIENPLAGYTERTMLDIGDKVTKTGDTKELSSQRGKLANAQFVDIVQNAGNDFGNVGSPFLIKSRMMDKFVGLSDSKKWHFLTSIYLGRAYLEGADSMHKIALTQRAFTNNLIKLLIAKGTDKQVAINQVSDALTGQSFQDAMVTAQELINTVNEQAGKEMLPNNKQSVTLLANDIVKNALIEGGLISEQELKATYRSAYTVAGLGMGHEANNPISDGIKKVNQGIQKNLQQAIKNKEWGEASWYKIQNVIFNNFMNPFVGGGTNWLILTATKMGINPLGYINMLRKQVSIDPSTVAGQKKLQENLTKAAERKNDTIRTLNGAMIGLSLYVLTKAVDDDDDLQEWLNKNKWAQPYFTKMSPPALGMLLASQAKTDGDEKPYNEWLANTFQIKSVDYFADSKKIVRAFQLLNPKDQTEYNDAMGALGQLTLGKVNSPVPSWGIAKQVDNIIRGLNGQEPVASDYKTTGYLNGAFQGGMMEYFGLRPKGNVSMYDVSKGREINLEGKERKMYDDMLALTIAEHVEAKAKDLEKLSPAKRLAEVKKITTKASKEVLETMSGYSDSIGKIEKGDVTYELTKDQIADRMKFAKEFRERNPNLLTVIQNNNRVRGEITAETRIKARSSYKERMNAYTKSRMLEKDKIERSRGREYLKEK